MVLSFRCHACEDFIIVAPPPVRSTYCCCRAAYDTCRQQLSGLRENQHNLTGSDTRYLRTPQNRPLSKFPRLTAITRSL